MKFGASYGCSWDWKSILWGHDLLLRGVGWRVGEGCKNIVFGHKWIPCSSNPYLILAPSGINNFQDKGVSVGFASLATMVEAMTILGALQWAKRMGLYRVEILMDCLVWKWGSRGKQPMALQNWIPRRSKNNDQVALWLICTSLSLMFIGSGKPRKAANGVAELDT
ncbi:hypothetical protein RHMOL_Rhmol12G0171200 [Rhododendron molle]|uniref:Uncharacterized protein n=1 Tax=Rhododendron molle TaxID=49168 RepID=A0ACC0LJ14_RHOML|nr:hypothetical protein RHMOL_Rhmol12G0171200 [Rhododendron molle]